MSTLSSFFEVLTYLLAGAFSVYGAFFALDTGLSAFAAASLLCCFASAAYSIYKMLVQEREG